MGNGPASSGGRGVERSVCPWAARWGVQWSCFGGGGVGVEGVCVCVTVARWLQAGAGVELEVKK